MSHPSRSRAAQGAASRERILQAALELLGKRGYAATSVSAICERAGVAKTALYWHFGSKEGLLLTLLKRTRTTWIEEIQKSTSEAGDPAGRLDRFVAGLRRLVEHHHEILCLHKSVTLEHADLHPEICDEMRRIQDRITGAITEGIEDALGRRIPGLDLAAFTALSLLDRIAFLYRLDPDGIDLDRLFEHAKEMIGLAIRRAIQHAEAAGADRNGGKP